MFNRLFECVKSQPVVLALINLGRLHIARMAGLLGRLALGTM